MGYLPGIESASFDGSISGNKWLFIIFCYASIVVACLILALAVYNFVVFVVMGGRWRVMPVLTFYLLALVDLGLRICTMIFVIPIDHSENVLAIYDP